MRTPQRIAAVLAVLALGAPRLAAADGLDGERFTPSVGIEGTFAVEHPSVAAPWDWGLGLFFNYARDPIVVRDGGDVTSHVLQQAATADLVGSVGLFGFAELGFDLPVHLLYEGDGYSSGGAMLAPDAGVGDLRLVPKFALLRHVSRRERLQLGLGVPVTLPTGDPAAARGAGGVTVTPELMFAFHKYGIGVGFDAGYRYRSVHPAGLPWGDAVVVEPWLAYAATPALTLRLELLTEKEVATRVPGADFPAELIGGLGYKVGSSVELYLGGGAGVSDGIGAPRFRILTGLRYRHWGSGKGGYYQDSDDDGIPDRRDRCPDSPEDYDGYQDDDGCPEADNDQDGIPDDHDECPQLPGDRAHDGCPAHTYVKVVSGRIYVFGKVQFATGSAHIDDRSQPLLDQVAAALRENPEVRHVRIDGHTDNIGGPDVNQRLSEERAAAVKSALERRGIAPGRLSTRGWGESRPVAPNRTAAGRARNRRVEFTIAGGR